MTNQPIKQRRRTTMHLLLLSVLAIASTESFTAPSVSHRSQNTIRPLSAYRDVDSFSPASSVDVTVASSTKKKPPSTLPNGGRLTLLGAGPGDPDLLTLKAHSILSDPNNLVIVDRLVSREILDVVRGEVRKANKHPGCAERAQDEIYEWCKEGLREGRHVVRLKIGECFFLFLPENGRCVDAISTFALFLQL